MRAWITRAALLVVAFAHSAGVARAEVAVPEGYRLGDYRAPTPDTVPGGVTVDVDQAKALVAAGRVWPIFVKTVKRSTVAPRPWLLGEGEPLIPGSLWLPNVGLGELDAETAVFFRRHLDALTIGQVGEAPGRGLMFYCYTDCWVSWNAAKRAAAWGYGPVYWFSRGVDGWALEGQPTEVVTPVPPPD